MRREFLTTGRNPKICVPLVGETEEQILSQAAKAKEAGPDIVEWRADFLGSLDREELSGVLTKLRAILQDTPLEFTWRTHHEGGRQISQTDYEELLSWVIFTRQVEYLDVEYYRGLPLAAELIAQAGEETGIILSYHNFNMTPSRKAMSSLMKQMARLKPAAVKLVVMPQAPPDVLRLMSATTDYFDSESHIPAITIAMGDMGWSSRVSGFLYGSCVTYATVEGQSAPGQLDIEDMRRAIGQLYR